MTKTKIIANIIGCLSMAALIVGCASTGSNPTNNTALEQFAITSGVAIGTSELVSQSDGAQYRPEFVLAEAVLNGIATGTNSLTTSQVTAELTQAGVTNNVVAPIIINALQLADSYASSGTNSTTQQWAGWGAAGIAEGLGSSTTAQLKLKYNKN